MKRREFLRSSCGAILAFPGLSTATGLRWLMPDRKRQTAKRLVVMFSPNGMVRNGFWPQTEGPDFEMDQVLRPLEPFREKTLVVHGVCNQVRGDGDNHMRGMGCLLTGNELLPGNIQGGSHTPAGWASGISIDQEISRYLQSTDHNQTRFGSLEFGILVPDKADPWTRMSFLGPNQPVAPISDPYRMFEKMYGTLKDKENLLSLLGDLKQDFGQFQSSAIPEDQAMLQRHQKFLQSMEKELTSSSNVNYPVAPLELPANVANVNDNMPDLSKMQIDLLVNGFQNDLNRVATLQYTNSVGQARMKFIGVDEGHHALSHHPDKNEKTQEKLRRINTWYCEQLAYLCKKLQAIPEPGSNGTMLDHTLVVWTNELGHGNSHSLNDLPFVMVGGGFGFEMGRFTKVKRVSTTRVWLAIAQAMGHELGQFGLAELCKDGAIKL
ncbi:MAG: DUF1552 domain-containing protein [Planctomycetota bacterium]